MRSRIFRLTTLFVVMLMMLASINVAPTVAVVGPETDTLTTATKPVTPSTTNRINIGISETGLYIVQLSDPSLATYQGGISGLTATSPEVTGTRRLDTSTPESHAYINYLDVQQAELLDDMEAAFGRPVEVAFQYKNVLNAVAVSISHDEALQALNLAGVHTVYPDTLRVLDTDIGPTLIGAPSIWTGDTQGALATHGEGIIIGMIDTGINHAHPSFADLGGDSYNHINPYGLGIYVGWCETNPTFCNDKLIGAYGLNPVGGSPEDTEGHGSHTASTAGGNFTDVEIPDGAGGTIDVTISGVAPHANIIAYKVCNPGCPGTASIAAVDLAITDDVDVLNYSISGGDDPWNDPVDLAFLDAFTAGIFVSASAGNDGPGAGTVAKTGPWNAAVAASTHSRIIAHELDVVATAGPLLGLGAVEGTGPALAADFTDTIIWGGDINPSNINGCTAWPAGSFTGAIGMVQRGTCAFAVKVNNLVTAGAVGALVYNNAAGPATVMGGLELTTVPSMMVSLGDGLDIVNLIEDDPTAQATMYKAQGFVYNTDWQDIMAGFSSRGPSQWELLKPDYTAPGVNILAAVAASGADPVQYGFLQGTSMSSPHGAGAAALMMALRPTWSPAEIKSAIASTASQTVFDSDGVTPADPFDDGSGRINLSAAAYAGFVLNETKANYEAANPSLNGQPNTLNQPSMVDYSCVGSCSWERTIKSTLPSAQEWTVSFDSDPNIPLDASPLVFTLAPGASQTIVITANITTGLVGKVYFGDIILTPTEPSEASVGHMPVVVAPATASLPGLVNIITDERTGTKTISDVQVISDVVALTAEVAGLGLGERHELSVNEDPTNTDAFNNLNEVFWTTFKVPAGTLRLVAEVVISEALDVDLYVGTGTIPSVGTIACTSATGVWNEYCNVNNPVGGDYWVLVQNWDGSADQPDRIVAYTAMVGPVDAGNMTVTGPTSVPGGDPFDLNVNWDEPSMMGGDYWYGQFALGTDPTHPRNLGSVNVNLDFLGARMSKTGPEIAHPGETIHYDITIDFGADLSGTASLTDTLPAGIEIITSTLTSTFGTAWYDELDNAVYWEKGLPASPAQAVNPAGQVRGLSLALEAANLPESFTLGGATPDGAPLEMVLDDGVPDSAVGIGGTWEFGFINTFTVDPALYPIQLDEIWVPFVNASVLVGDPIVLVIYQDPDSDPSNGADFVAAFPTTVIQQSAWNGYAIPPVILDGPGDVMIGVVALKKPGTGYFPAALDKTLPQHRSWYADWEVTPPPTNYPVPPPGTGSWMLIDDAGSNFVGNWMVEGYGQTAWPGIVTISFDAVVTAKAGEITNTAQLDYNGKMFEAGTTLQVTLYEFYLPLIMKAGPAQ
jgi:uncharacterized repeat protein (TIGR01451 family)